MCHSNKLHTRVEDQSCISLSNFQEHEIKEALNRADNGKVVGLDNIHTKRTLHKIRPDPISILRRYLM